MEYGKEGGVSRYYSEKKVLFRKVPCIVPGGIRQIKELLNEQQAETH